MLRATPSEQGAKALAVTHAIDGIRAATKLPLLWIGPGTPEDADAVCDQAGDDHAHGDLELVVDVRDEEELELVLEQLDPEIFLLCAPRDRRRARSARRGARAAAGCARRQARDRPTSRSRRRDEVLALERAGIDAVLVPHGARGRPRRPPAVRRLAVVTRATMAPVTSPSRDRPCSRPPARSSRAAAAKPRRPLRRPPRPRSRRARHPAGWQKLANRIHAPVYCPGWLPDPLIDQIGGQWNNINSVSPDRSYLESFVWQETDGGAAGGELHVNLRAYPGVTKIPTLPDRRRGQPNVPCFDDAARNDHRRRGSRRRSTR